MSDERLEDVLRHENSLRWRRVANLADPDCRICRGRGWTSGYVAPSKPAWYPCPCTGEADWQR